MPTYEFRSKDGLVVERVYPMSTVPRRIRIDGKAFTRQIGAGLNGIVREHRHIAYSLPRLWQEPELAKVWGKFDDRGHIVCEGKRDVDNLQARLADRGGYKAGYTYDAGTD
jgi:hypothetical protein